MGILPVQLRIDPAKARQLIEGGDVTVIDLTSSFVGPVVQSRIPGAIHMRPNPLLDRNRRDSEILASLPPIPKDRPIIAYCTCPAEEASARLAQILRKEGYEAWALAGGLPAWRAAGYPLAPARATA